MPRQPFASLPDSARLWVFAAARPLDSQERDALLTAADAFLDQWNAHKVPLACARELRHDQFLLVGVDEAASGVSGCSVDSLVRTMKGLGQQLGVDLLDHASVFYRDGEAVRRVSREAFADAVASGGVDLATTVFDNTVPTVGALRAGRWESPASETWHARAFF
ncbi:hypothetical protein TBR22_A20780 [Luteitalea sp. TBR-22]|uniref:hypothetical protein n=1 Tax=Luteitalea sp. TBR-22 TaxID=2802971 RepID=UPI001AF2F6B0|nr:hypothetical protein [Luteitalea sp. TBR-22]BCS32854.1 hypothetical protein TBR22_A20780 [Luteitalea sp. TBR-22]